MRFGGHQTFSLRDGWLHKGLRMVHEDPERFADPDVGDWLGVGKNMAKAIHHWMLATGLAERQPSEGRQTRILQPTPFGAAVWLHDRYFLFPGTWWAVHLQLLHHPDDAFSWKWFFNRFASTRFERGVCVEGLRRHIESNTLRMPSARTLERDVNCLLRSYAVSVPREQTDPEDALECPLSELGLLSHSRQTGFFHLDRTRKDLPFFIFGYALALAGASDSGAAQDLSLTELTHGENAPGRAFAMTAEATYEVVANYADQGLIRLDGQTGERIVRIDGYPSSEWLSRYYEIAKREQSDSERVA